MAFRSTWSPNFDCLLRAGNQGVSFASGNSLAVWCRLDNLSANYEAIEINDSTGQPFASAIVLNSGTTTLEFLQRNSAGAQIAAFGTPVAAVWQHLVLTYDNTTLRAYINGVQVDSTAAALAGPRGTWADIQVGPALGNLDNAFFFTRALSADEVAWLYRCRMPRFPTGMRHWLPCYPGAAARRVDYSGNALNFTDGGTPADQTTESPSLPWGAGRGRLILPAASALAITADGLTQCTGSASQGKGYLQTANGLVQCNGGVSLNQGLNASGITQVTGSATRAVNFAQTANGLVQTNGAAAGPGLGFALTADGLTRVYGAADLTGGGGGGGSRNVRLWRRGRDRGGR